MDLHLPTLYISSAAGYAMLALLLTVAQFGPLRRDPVIRAWTLGHWACSAGFVAILLRDTIPQSASVVLGNLGTELGLTLFAVAVHRFLRDRSPGPWLWWLFGLQVAVLIGVRSHVQPLRVSAASLSHALLIAPMLWWLYRDASQRTGMLLMVLISLLLTEAMLLFRAVDAMFHPQHYETLFVQGWRQGLIYWAAFLFLFSAGFGFALANLERLARRLHQLASEDPLTGCLNRRAADERLREAIAAGVSPEQALTLVLLDLDHFKQVNDRHGHHCGDRALLHFAKLAQSLASERAVLARLGGEEFALWLPGQGSAAGEQIAERLRREVAGTELADHEGRPIALTVSAGVASASLPRPTEAIDFIGLFARADRALYRAKAQGRNRVAVDAEVLPAGVEPCCPT